MLTYEATGETLEYLSIVLDQAMRLRDIVNDMLSLTDLRAGITELAWADIPLAETIARVIEPLKPQLEDRAVQVVTEIEADCAIIRADRERLALILEKLVSNAIKFSPPGEKVIIRARADHDRATISVSDRGPGIPSEAQRHLFTPFYQTEESLRRTHGGMGLGLAIAKGMVELHGGEIWVESVPDQGATFSFSIPQTRPA